MAMDEFQIFEIIREFAEERYSHPDYVARLHAALMRIERVMMDHVVEWRENG